MNDNRLFIRGIIILALTIVLPNTLPAQIWETPELEDGFGTAVVMGDFNGDDHMDIAVGVPEEDLGGFDIVGGVHVIYGTDEGLTVTGNQFWHQEVNDIEGWGEADDQFGFSLASGDFNGDGFYDLAVGAPGEAVGELAGAGAVNVLYGSDAGITADNNKQWYQDVDGVEGDSEAGDQMGYSLASGDFNMDGYDDLAIGAPGEAVGQLAGAGAVNVLYGSDEGITADNNKQWYQDVNGVEGWSETGDQFGFSLASGDFNMDGYDDLAIGAPGEAVGQLAGAGAVNVLYGSDEGITAANNKQWYQDVDGVEGDSEAGDQMGYSLASGDFDGDGFDDLAIGTPGEAVGQLAGAGAVNVLYGSDEGITAANNKQWYQDVNGVEGWSETGDQMGYSLASGDFDGDRYDDLAIGAPGEAVGQLAGAGAVNVLYGSDAGITTSSNKQWYQDTENVEDTSEADDRFGAALSTGDIDGDGFDDLGIGIPGEGIQQIAGAGAVSVLNGSENGITDTGNNFWYQGVESGDTSVPLAQRPQISMGPLYPNYPNPFNAITTIVYTVSRSSHIQIVVSDTRGRFVKTLVDEMKNIGHHTVQWDGQNEAGQQVGSGVYYYTVKRGAGTETNRMILLK
jgi:3-hydroxy-3-methylglutaryl CoA synthase